MELIKFSDRMNRIVPDNARLLKLNTDFNFIEGPVWDSEQQCLFFSDIPASTIYQWHSTKGLTIFRKPSNQSNGLTLNAQGCLLACEHESRKLTLTSRVGTVEVLASHYMGRRLNSPNDAIVMSDGSIYFTDPPYGLSRSDEQELPFQGVYRLDPQSGKLDLLVDDFDRPNGLAFSPDEKILYIDDSARQHVRAFDINTEGSLINDRLFAELDPSVGDGVPDGLKVDREGHVYVTGPGGIWILSPTGEKIGVIKTPEVAANLAWGGEDFKHLFITASTSLYQIKLNIAGIPVKMD